MLRLIGSAGSALLACCSFPEVYRTWKFKKTNIGWGMILPWLFGSIFSLIYVSTLHNNIVIANTLSNLIAAAIITYYKFKYRD